MQTETKNNIPVLNSMNELSDFITKFWIGMIENGRFEMPFSGNSKIVTHTNIARFMQVAEDVKVFSEEQVVLITERTRGIVEKLFLKGRKVYGYTAYSSPKGYLEEMFAGISVPHERFPLEVYLLYIPSRIDYEEILKEDRCGGKEGKAIIMKNYPGTGGVLCQSESGGYWKIIASVHP